MATHSATTTPHADRFAALVGVINRECVLLQHLVFKLRSAEMLANAGEARFITLISDEVDSAALDLGAIEVARALLVADVTHQLGIPDDATLLELTEHAPEEIFTPLQQARSRLIDLMEELDDAARAATGAVTDRLDEVHTSLDTMQLSEIGGISDRYGVASVAPAAATRFDREL